MAPNVRLVSVIKRKLAAFLHTLTPQTELLMNPYFVPELALLLMEGVSRRALSHADRVPAAAYPRTRATDDSRRSQATSDRLAERKSRIARHFGQPGSFR